MHELAVEDAVNAHQRAKLERYGDTLFCVLRPARYIDETETVEFGEVHVFAGPQVVITVRHGQAPDLAAVRRGLEARPDLLRRGPVAILHAIMDRVVDDLGVADRINVTLDPEYAAKLSRLAERMHVQEGTLAKSLGGSGHRRRRPSVATSGDIAMFRLTAARP